MSSNSIEIDIPCDPQQLGELAMPFALLSEARDPGQDRRRRDRDHG